MINWKKQKSHMVILSIPANLPKNIRIEFVTEQAQEDDMPLQHRFFDISTGKYIKTEDEREKT